jgi:hypothetical protein
MYRPLPFARDLQDVRTFNQSNSGGESEVLQIATIHPQADRALSAPA